MKSISKLVLASILSVMLFSGCGFNKSKDAIIIINGNPITKQEYQAKFEEEYKNPMYKQIGLDLKQNPNDLVGTMVKDKIVNELMVKNIINAEIERRKIKVSDKEVDEALKKMIDKIGSKEKFNALLQQNGISPKQFKKDLVDELKAQKLIDSLAIVNVTDDMTKKYYKANINQFKYPDKVRASHILISINPEKVREGIVHDPALKNLTPQEVDKRVKDIVGKKYKEAEEILNKVKKDPSKFATLAKESSDDPGSAQHGGDLGYFTKDEMVEPFAKAAFSMKPSTISGIVETKFGYHIIYVKDRIAAGVEPYDKVKNDIKAYLENLEKINILRNFVNNARKEAKIEYVDPSFNPEELQKQIKKLSKDNQIFQQANEKSKNSK